MVSITKVHVTHMLPDETIELLEAKLLDGDTLALAEVFERFRPRLERFVRHKMDPRLRGRVDPADILQELYVAAEQRLQNYCLNPRLPVYVWLREIGTQRLLDVHRKHLSAQKRSANVETSLDSSSRSLAYWIAEDISSPSQRLAQVELVDQLYSTMKTLSDVDREILYLRHFEELTNDEVAAILKITKAGASNRYVRALMRLRKALEKTPGFNDQL